MVKVSVVSLDFGLIQFGRSSTLKFDIINESHCHVSFQLNQVVKDKKVFIVSLAVIVFYRISQFFYCEKKMKLVTQIVLL